LEEIVKWKSHRCWRGFFYDFGFTRLEEPKSWLSQGFKMSGSERALTSSICSQGKAMHLYKLAL